LPSLKGGISGIMIIINVKDGESLDKALKRFKKKFEKTGVLRELRSRQAFEKKSVTRRHVVKHAIYKQNMNQETTV
jgi:small subunit ribosomal protein S21